MSAVDLTLSDEGATVWRPAAAARLYQLKDEHEDAVELRNDLQLRNFYLQEKLDDALRHLEMHDAVASQKIRDLTYTEWKAAKDAAAKDAAAPAAAAPAAAAPLAPPRSRRRPRGGGGGRRGVDAHAGRRGRLGGRCARGGAAVQPNPSRAAAPAPADARVRAAAQARARRWRRRPPHLGRRRRRGGRAAGGRRRGARGQRRRRARRRAPAAAAPPAKSCARRSRRCPSSSTRVAPGAGVLQVRWRGEDYEPTRASTPPAVSRSTAARPSRARAPCCSA